MAVEKSVETLRKNVVSEAIASDGNWDHPVKAASFAKTLVEKEIMLKDVIMALEKLEEEFKLLKLFITFIRYLFRFWRIFRMNRKIYGFIEWKVFFQ